MFYKVVKKYTRGPAIDVGMFVDASDAKLLIKEKLREDAQLKVNVTYQLLEGGEVIEEFAAGSAGAGEAGGQQRSSGQTFAPTPFNAAPRPAGIPHNWVKDDTDKDTDSE